MHDNQPPAKPIRAEVTDVTFGAVLQFWLYSLPVLFLFSVVWSCCGLVVGKAVLK